MANIEPPRAIDIEIAAAVILIIIIIIIYSSTYDFHVMNVWVLVNNV